MSGSDFNENKTWRNSPLSYKPRKLNKYCLINSLNLRVILCKLNPFLNVFNEIFFEILQGLNLVLSESFQVSLN